MKLKKEEDLQEKRTLVFDCYFIKGQYGDEPLSKYGYEDGYGNLVIPKKWNDAFDFSEGLAAVRDGHLWGFVNRAEKFSTPCSWYRVKPFSEGLALVEHDRGWGSSTSQGNSSYHVIGNMQRVFLAVWRLCGTSTDTGASSTNLVRLSSHANGKLRITFPSIFPV